MSLLPSLIAALLPLSSAPEATASFESPRSSALEIKLGGVTPLIDRETSLLGGRPYAETFTGSMLLFELELDRQLWQQIGSAGVGLSMGYAEKYARARIAGTGEPAAETTALKVLPIKLLGVYRFDYGARRYGIPLVPYAKAGLAATPFWILKGGEIEVADGLRGEGVQWGYSGTLGLSLLLDVLEPRLARDMDSTSGVNHSYLFAEYVAEEVSLFRTIGPDLSSRHWMFGLMLEY
ncbi:MAG: hypothetical protein HYZ28_27440 [Myxococcales bacterium]|nr:hypothetical protein [Myxococcales bacterium]